MSEKIYFYSWDDDVSSDPRWEDLTSKKAKITCGGVILRHALYCVTGIRGIVKIARVDSHDKPITKNGHFVTNMCMGKVEVEFQDGE